MRPACTAAGGSFGIHLAKICKKRPIKWPFFTFFSQYESFVFTFIVKTRKKKRSFLALSLELACFLLIFLQKMFNRSISATKITKGQSTNEQIH